MFEKLEKIRERFEEIYRLLQLPETVSDQELYRDLNKEYKNLTPVVEEFNRYLDSRREAEEADEILSDPDSDEDLREMAKEQKEEALAAMQAGEEELKVLLLPKDEDDDKSVIMEIRAGAGGEEAALFAADLYRMYSMYAAAQNWKTEVVNENETELGGYKEISFMVEGKGAYSRLKYESGVHRVQRVPETEAQGRIQTSTCTVATLPEAEDVELEINPKDLQIDTFRSSGAGGQHVNKTESAIRITYLPTGLVVECQDERSQYKNKDRAMKILRSKLLEEKKQEQQGKIAEERRSQVGTGDRSERIRTYNFPQGRVTDHRINLTLYRIESIMNGDLNEIIDSLATADRAEKLRAAGTDN
ncbi:MAG: peptide chain release factor 1 [Oscillospiraceae bacterium]|nr:peptide chain release factor 1 [Oscillospiraceae bacterium]MBR5045731.1 peptide chain release factor 1 [Oscillospiraceae bacterium]MBR5071567.1 peptide chain release factor 1 [Oscillospiraceae bacterium]MBR5979329.1 peptide chain release factor 1 [Oscillospiraceae bacterium]